ncbi:MAG: HEAT repeat domain-containing protein [Gammaproteobacteria bacterium]|jgi:hypothetical protein|nr:HEAT repeat domain-containing protein [Gammaproteobacteria bacterium]
MPSAPSDIPGAPDALLLIANGCPHCPTVLAGLSELIKQGRLGRLEVVNITVRPDVAQAHGVRGVPWLRLGPFELTGLRSPAELARWVERSASPQGMADYFSELFDEGRLADVAAMVERDPQHAAVLVALLGDPEAALQVRLGAAAAIEHLEGSAALRAMTERLAELTRHADARVRADACHALALGHDPGARPHIEALLQDPDAVVREVAAESLATL